VRIATAHAAIREKKQAGTRTRIEIDYKENDAWFWTQVKGREYAGL